ncbi:MAG: UDP-N-acetylmuramoyl-L-alanyl-D-glutamate--2,6-diaminopimelate ligase [Legionella sp.]|nr:UDP-N-acetylmuramoyl-L-alanyl-D-glutamate--2,6-diaminopimelate ligase [Legionella sp.]
MKLTELLKPWIDNKFTDCEISGLHNDSRQVGNGFLFIAYPGAATDGRLYINQALNAGAVAVIYEPAEWPALASIPSDTISIPFPGLAQHLASIASRFYGNPTRKLSVTGITGTNGKTTIAYQLAQAHELLANPAAYIGTLGYGGVSSLQPLVNTTPDALCLQHIFHTCLQEQVNQVCMEVSSHALALQRVDSIDFKQAIFTNLTLDHLDFHQTMDAYAAAKAMLFACSSLQWAIVNHDDSYASLMKSAVRAPCKILSYGVEEGSDVRALSWDITLKGTVIDIDSPWGRHHLTIKALGFFNVYNALAVFTSLMACGYEVASVIEVMAKLLPAPGRMEVVTEEPYTIVDYAHTPDALEKVLSTLTEVKKGRIITVFGCGGDRDKTKRPIMGEIAARYADVAIVTSDNPRSEDPVQILRDIEKGIDAGSTEIFTIADREQAIAKALSIASVKDIVLVAGKGHEAYQQIGQVRHVFSDKAVIKRLMKTLQTVS